MARKPFVVIDAEILSSSVWSEAAHVRLVWLTLLILCDTEGYVGAAVPGIARAAGVPLEQAREALALLQEPDPDSRTRANEGRRLVLADRGFIILNFREHLDRLSVDRMKARDRVRKFRERKRQMVDGNVTVLPGNREQGTGNREQGGRTDSVAYAPAPPAPYVPVQASVGAPVNPLVKPVKPGRETWLTPFGDDWREAYGGDPTWGELARVLKKPVDDLGAPEVRTRWRLYLGQTEGRYASPTRFAQTIGVWTDEAVARMQPKDMRSMTVGDFNAQTYERVLKRLREKDDARQGELAQGPAQARGLLPDPTQ